jgi:hypothetical protein
MPQYILSSLWKVLKVVVFTCTVAFCVSTAHAYKLVFVVGKYLNKSKQKIDESKFP